MSDWKDKPWRPKDVYREKQENNWLRDRLLEHAEEMRQFSAVDFMSKSVVKGDVTVETIWFSEYGLQTMEGDSND